MDEKIAVMMKKLGISEEEARELVAYDEGNSNEYDLTDEQKVIARKYTKSDTHEVKNKVKHERKVNQTKLDIINHLTDILANYEAPLDFQNVEIVNKEREITFSCNENEYSLTLIQHRKPKT